MQLTIRIRRELPGSYKAWCPALPGCEVWAGTVQEAREKIEDAIAGYLENIEQALPRELERLAVRDDPSLEGMLDNPLEQTWRRKAMPGSLDHPTHAAGADLALPGLDEEGRLDL